MESSNLLEKKIVTGAALDKDILHVTLSCKDCSTMFVKDLFDKLDEFGVNIDMISQVISNNIINISFTCKDTDRNFLNRSLENLSTSYPNIDCSIDSSCCKVSIVGSGMRDVSGVAARAFRTLCKNGIEFLQVTTSEISISFALKKDDGKEAIRLLCLEFNI